MNKRNTKQKQLILDYLRSDKTHPTIQEVYMRIQNSNSKIGIATVYRNVNKLVDEKEIIKLPVGNVPHYDGNTIPHNHFICRRCNKIIDLFDNDYDSLINSVEDKHKLKIEKITILYEGVCEECNDKL